MMHIGATWLLVVVGARSHIRTYGMYGFATWGGGGGGREKDSEKNKEQRLEGYNTWHRFIFTFFFGSLLRKTYIQRSLGG